MRSPRCARSSRRSSPLVFQGEEYGEDAPFQFFTDHIDEDIAEATRKGRREEFASFAAFAGEDVPDPQASETFDALEADAGGRPGDRRSVPADALALRRELPPGDVDEIAVDADVPSLRVTRGPWTLVCDFREMTGEIVGPG